MSCDRGETCGTVFNIQRFSLHDGPGIRTTVFLAGCPLRCNWCHNPEGFSKEPRLRFLPKCIGCGNCVAVCKNGVHIISGGVHTVDFGRCILCRKCVEACPSGALLVSGERMTVRELVEKVLLDQAYFGKDGGVTFSGGEPLLQTEFVSECMRFLRERDINCAIDTSGAVPFENIRKAAEYADIFLYDIKAYTEKLHRKGTGVGNREILKNLRRLDELGKQLYIRIPVISDINATKQEMKKIARFIGTLKNVKEVTLLPYHTFGREKYSTLGMETPLEKEPIDGKMSEFQNIFGI